ncbi:MAG: hypothetical protein MK102_08705 [Fuerstiella sp.]|nr:hypothetical protein [Fuerstiella sp.]
MKLFLVLILLVAVWSTNADAHPGHTQLTEVEWNPASARFEVAMKLDAAALEDSMSLQFGKHFRLEASEEVDKKLAKWMLDHFRITFSDFSRDGHLRWVGHELQRQSAWLYFEYIPVRGSALTGGAGNVGNDASGRIDLNQVRLENWCVLNVRPDAVHHVILRDRQEVRYGYCSFDQPVLELTVQPDSISGMPDIRRDYPGPHSGQ